MIDYEKLKEIRNMGYIKHTGIRTVELREGYAKCEIILDERHANPIGSTHGGVLFTLVDTVGGAAATSRGRYVTTVSGNINYLRPAMTCKKLIGESREIKVGKKMCVDDVMITAAEALDFTGAMKHQENPVDLMKMFSDFIQQRRFNIIKGFACDQSPAGAVGVNRRNHLSVFRFVHLAYVQILNALVVKGNHIVVNPAELRDILVGFGNKFTD